MNTERLQQIELFIKKQKQVTVAELSNYLGVSQPTIRRDLQKLEVAGVVQREHGKMIAVEHAIVEEPPVIQRIGEQGEEKTRIARATANLINDGETVFLGAGTTVLEVARHLEGKKNLIVITNSLPIIQLLSTNPAIKVIITGGVLRHSELSFIGHIVEQTLQELRGDKVVLSMRAISIEGGLCNVEPLETTTIRAVMRFAREVILVVDHTKFDRVTANFVAPVTDVHHIVTDEQAPVETIRKLREMGINVVLA